VNRAWSTARVVPVSLTLGTTLVATMAVTELRASTHESLVRLLGVTGADLAALQLWRVPTSALVQQQTGMVWPIIALLPALVAAELRFGSVLTLATYVLVDAISTVPVLGALALAGVAGSGAAERLANTPNLGSSAALVGLLAASIATLAGRPRLLAASALVIGMAGGLVLDWELAGVQHAIAAIAGGAVGLWLSQRRRNARRQGGETARAQAAQSAVARANGISSRE
jgi:hypothetical protein